MGYLSKKLILVLILCGFIISFQTRRVFNNFQSKIKYNRSLENKTTKIRSCIDIQNKNKRNIYENIELSEYCINKFGSNKE